MIYIYPLRVCAYDDVYNRLGVLWKTMSKDVKEKYFALAREVDAEHKRKYPGSCVFEI